MANSSDFYIHLPSNSHENNFTGNFTVRLAENISLDGDWELALTSIIYPYTWTNLPSTVDKHDIVSTSIHVALRSGQIIYPDIEEGQYSTLDDLLLAIRWAFRKTVDSYRLINPEEQDNSEIENFQFPGTVVLKDLIQISINPISHLFSIKWDLTKIAGIAFSRELAYILGFKSHVFGSTYSKPKSEIGRWHVENASYPPNLKADRNVLYIYCDLLLPQLVGNSLAPLLSIVHTEGAYGNSVEKNFIHPQYIPLLIKQFSTIHIDIKDERGRYIKFTTGKSILTLHFRRKRPILD